MKKTLSLGWKGCVFGVVGKNPTAGYLIVAD